MLLLNEGDPAPEARERRDGSGEVRCGTGVLIPMPEDAMGDTRAQLKLKWLRRSLFHGTIPNRQQHFRAVL